MGLDYTNRVRDLFHRDIVENILRANRPAFVSSWLRALLLGSFLLVTWLLIAWLAAQALVVSTHSGQQADALVVLGGSGVYRERNDLAAQLFKAGVAPVVILMDDNEQSGWSETEQRNPLFVERAAEELHRAGVPYEKIVKMRPPAASTYGEAVLMREHMGTQRMNSLLLVTSGYHSRRALWTWRRVFRGYNTQINISSVPPGSQTPSRTFWWLHLSGWRMVALEYPKMIYYWIRYH